MGNQEPDIYSKINEFENKSDLFKYCFKNTGIPMWLFIRTFLVFKAVRADEPHTHSKKNVSMKNRLFDEVIKENPFLELHKDIVYAFWTYEILKIDVDGHSNDTTIMPFMQENFRKSVALMNGKISDGVKLKGEYPSLKSDFFFRNFLKKSTVPKEDVVSIKSIIYYIEMHFPWKIDNQIKKTMHEILMGCSKYLDILVKRFSLYLGIINPKLVIVSCANYVDLYGAALIIACKKRNIVTAEIQHAWIGKKHLQYFFSDYIISDPKCRMVFPDYLLTMGKYWNQQIKVPEKIYTVGCKKTIIRNVVQKDSILFAASTDHDRYFLFLSAFLSNPVSEGVTVYFRQHPMWKNTVKYASLNKYSNFIFADERDLDYYMSMCKYVIADGSTVCYEALYAKRIVFCFKGPTTDLYDISSFCDVKFFEDLYDFLRLWMDREDYIPQRHEDLFELDYKNKYRKFMKMCGCRLKQ